MQIESIHRFPVKSMAGETLPRAWLMHDGLVGDRAHALYAPGRNRRFPWYTGRQHPPLVRHAARYPDPPVPRHTEASRPLGPEAAALDVAVTSPEGLTVELDDPMFLAALPGPDGEALEALRDARGFPDAAPVSLLGNATVAALGEALGMALTPERFRMNLMLDGLEAFGEGALVGRRLRVGGAVLEVTEGCERCKMITIDPSDASLAPQVLKHVLERHGGVVGLYASVVQEGEVAAGDAVEVA